MKIAFVYYMLSPFVRQDYEVLSRHFPVEAVNYRSPIDIFSVARHIWRSDVSFSWFASGHSFIAVLISKLLGKKSVVVAGGYDVAYAPEIGYGQYTQGFHKRMYASFALKHADLVLAVSKFTKEEVLARTRPKRVEVLYNAVDTDKFRPGGKKEDIVLTVATGNAGALKLKGLDTFVKAASYLPEAKFIVLGLSEEGIESLKSLQSSDNVEMRGRVDQGELVGYYQKAKVYCQLSYRESFGVALAEAMACECVPVATERGALSEVVGDAGFYVPYGDEKATAEGIKKAFKSDGCSIARKRVKRLFGTDRREIELVKAIDMVINV
jgi:glycosyltransferase involved in cell wall biosynthesis